MANGTVTLLQAENYPEVFLIKDGIKHWIQNSETLFQLGYDWEDVQWHVPLSEVNKYPTGETYNFIGIPQPPRSIFFPPTPPPPPPSGETWPYTNLTGFMKILYRCGYPQELALARDMGINTVWAWAGQPRLDTLTEIGTYLNTAQSLGLKIIFPLCNRDLMNFAKGHPAFLAWNTADEPLAHGISKEEQISRYRYVKSLDPIHPVVICFNFSRGLENYTEDAFDFAFVARYPFLRGVADPEANIMLLIDNMRKVKRKDYAVIPLVQAVYQPPEGEEWPNFTSPKGKIEWQYRIYEREGFGKYGAGLWAWHPTAVGAIGLAGDAEMRAEVKAFLAKLPAEPPVIVLPPTYTCPYCPATFDSQEKLDTHIASEHPTSPETFTTEEITCSTCESVLKVTISSIAENNRTLTCPLCQTTLPEAGTKVEIISTPVIDQLRADIGTLDEQIGQAEAKVAEAKGKIAEAKAKVDAMKELLGM